MPNLNLKMSYMPIFANRHHLFVVSDRGEVPSYLTNLEFKIQIMKLIISDGGRGRYWYILHLPATKLSDLLKIIFATKWQINWEKKATIDKSKKLSSGRRFQSMTMDQGSKWRTRRRSKSWRQHPGSRFRILLLRIRINIWLLVNVNARLVKCCGWLEGGCA